MKYLKIDLHSTTNDCNMLSKHPVAKDVQNVDHLSLFFNHIIRMTISVCQYLTCNVLVQMSHSDSLKHSFAMPTITRHYYVNDEYVFSDC